MSSIIDAIATPAIQRQFLPATIPFHSIPFIKYLQPLVNLILPSKLFHLHTDHLSCQCLHRLQPATPPYCWASCRLLLAAYHLLLTNYMLPPVICISEQRSAVPHSAIAGAFRVVEVVIPMDALSTYIAQRGTTPSVGAPEQGGITECTIGCIV